jgi:hypothetical protein
MPGRFAEGPRHPGSILPASAVSEQETRKTDLAFFVAAQKLIALDRGYYSHRTLVAALGTLHAPEASDADRAGKCDFVGKSQKDLYRRAFLDVLPQVKVDPA